MIKGQFIEDLERLQELYSQRFIKYSNEYNFKGNQKAESKMYDYMNCVEKMKKVMQFVNQL